MVVGLNAGGTSYGFEDGSSDAYARVGGDWRLAWRDALDGGGYVGLHSLVGIDYLGAPVDRAQDTEYLSGEIALPVVGNRLILETSVLSSFNYGGDVGAFVEPDWGVTYRFTGERRAPEPYFGYRGGYRYEDRGDGDRMSNRGVLGIEYDPTVRFGTQLEAIGGHERYPSYDIPKTDGSPSDEVREDYLGEGRLTLDGLLGYFVDWQLDLTGGYRHSNADRYLDGPGEREKDSENRVESSARTRLRWTPTRSTAVEGSLGATTHLYTEREALDTDGSRTGEPLRVLDMEGSANVDWTPDDEVFLNLGSTVTREIANEADFDSWRWTAEIGLEFVLQ
ncbi:MAG: hypothetical protein ACLFUX_01610 [Spirochaetaceae bacterium]